MEDLNSAGAGNLPFIITGNDWDFLTTTTTTSNNTSVFNYGPNYDPKIDDSVKFEGKGVNKIDWDLSRFTLIERLKFLYNLLFRGKAVMEVEPKQIRLEKALEALRNAK